MSISSKTIKNCSQSIALQHPITWTIALVCLIFACGNSKEASASNVTYSTINSTIREGEMVGWPDEIAVLYCLEALESHGNSILLTEDSHFQIVKDQTVFGKNLREILKAQAESKDPKALPPRTAIRRFNNSLSEAKRIRASMYPASRSLNRRGTPLLYLDNRQSTKVYATGYTIEPDGKSEGLSVVCAFKQSRPYDSKKDATKAGLIGALIVAEVVSWNYNIRN